MCQITVAELGFRPRQLDFRAYMPHTALSQQGGLVTCPEPHSPRGMEGRVGAVEKR